MAAPSPAAVAAAPGNESDALATKPKSSAITPQKVREMIDEGIAPEEAGQDRKDPSAFSEVANGSPQTKELHFESTSKDAFFSRVETFTCLKWASKPHELSPLICAKYGWTNVECDMLKCSSCQAYLCASLQLSFDFSKYKERCLELQKALLGAHEKFCFWPDSPCPDRFSVLLVEEPRALLSDFLERFQTLRQLQLRLPSLKPDSLKNVSLTEEKVSFLLQLIEEEEEEEEQENCKTEGEKTSAKRPSDLQVHITASILALCGWTGSPPSGSIHLPMISCCRCIRRVGLWSFHQMESTETELENPSNVAAPAAERLCLGPTSPRRMITRSQDTSLPPGSEQHEKSPSPVISRARGADSFSERPEAEAASSPTTRSRPVTRSMGHGEACGLGAEVPSSPHRRAKRPRLYSSSSSDSSSTRVFFDPLAQHRDWCPWVSEVKEAAGLGTKGDSLEEKADHGWQVVLKVLQASRKSEKPSHLESESLSTKSRKVFQIFRQWEGACSS